MSRKLKQEYFRDGDKYVALTGESPTQFKGLMFAAFVGNNPGSIIETCLMHNQLEKMTRIEGADVPDAWADAFRAKGFVIVKPEPEPEPELEPDEPEYADDYEEYDPEEYDPPKQRTKRRNKQAVEVKLDFTPDKGTNALIGTFIMLTTIVYIVLSILQIVERMM